MNYDITYPDLKAYVAAHKKFGYAIDTANHPHNDKPDPDAPDFVGVYKGKHVWHWFKRWSDGTYDFDHSYSQNVGTAKRGMKQQFGVTFAIHSFLNKNR